MKLQKFEIKKIGELEAALKKLKSEDAEMAAFLISQNDMKELIKFIKTADAKVKATVNKYVKEDIELDEKLDPSKGAGEYVKDFKDSDAPQFKGKSMKDRQKMAIAAYLSAKRKKVDENVDVEKTDEGYKIPSNYAAMMIKKKKAQRKLSADQKKHMDKDNDGDIDHRDLKKLRDMKKDK